MVDASGVEGIKNLGENGTVCACFLGSFICQYLEYPWKMEALWGIFIIVLVAFDVLYLSDTGYSETSVQGIMKDTPVSELECRIEKGVFLDLVTTPKLSI